MVSKIAVMALVAVVAVPILLGYGLNINTESRQVWAENNDKLNARDYLTSAFDATGATFTNADTYQMNSNIFEPGMAPGIKLYPQYVGHTNTQTSIALSTDYNVPALPSLGFASSNGPSQVVINGGFDPVNYYQVTLYNENNAPLLTYTMVKYFTLDVEETATIRCYNSSGYIVNYTVNNVAVAVFSAVGSPTGQIWYEIPGRGDYIDITKGYRLNMDGAVWDPSNYLRPSDVTWTNANISLSTQSMLLTFDLSTVTDSAAMIRFQDYPLGYIWFKKTTTDGVVKWEYTSKYHYLSMEPYDFQELYYNPSIQSNTYQLYLNADYSAELRYIGVWTDTIGPAPSLITYEFEIDHNPLVPEREFITRLTVEGQSPVMRIDAARVGAYDYRVMEDAVYDPALFRSNPKTTITNGYRFGQSLEFGGNTYQVTKGNITIGTHEFSLEGMTFESVQVDGQYENRINGNTVSITATPSTLTLNGKWLTDVITQSQSTTTVTETKWEPGKFAWNGIDTDFKIAGLMASLGAFIALAVYGRRSGAKVMPLLVVCGGAALMFLVMI